ncbi:hypothetical protein ACPZ8L_24305 [Klebsiella variicola subsp. variicola]
MTNITELAQREKFEAWWEREYKHLESSKYTDAVPHIKYGFWMAYQAGGAELVEVLEKAQQHIARQEQILLNQDESLFIRRGELEAAQQERENWRTSFDNERFRADKLKAHIDEMTEERTASINELSRIIQKEVKAKREAEKRIAELEAQNTVASLPGGFSIEESRSLQADLVRSHISKALSGEKMKSADKNADLQWIHSVIVRAAWFVKASVEATAGIKVEAE